MRPILVNIPSKLLFAVALVLAVAAFARDLWRRRQDPKAELTSTPLYLLAGAEVLIGLKSGSWTPSGEGFHHAWTPTPTRSERIRSTSGPSPGRATCAGHARLSTAARMSSRQSCAPPITLN